MKKILITLLMCLNLALINVNTVNASSTFALQSYCRVNVTQEQYNQNILDDYSLYILCTTDNEIIESTKVREVGSGFYYYYEYTLNSNFRTNENYSYIFYLVNPQGVKEYVYTLTDATTYQLSFADFSPYLQQDENEDDAETDIEGSTTVVVDLSETNKILNNIFVLLVFAFIYCYLLNPLVKILKFKKGDR